MDWNQVYTLLAVIEKLQGHPKLVALRDAAAKELEAMEPTGGNDGTTDTQ